MGRKRVSTKASTTSQRTRRAKSAKSAKYQFGSIKKINIYNMPVYAVRSSP